VFIDIMASAITLTFGDAAENHTGMEILGSKTDDTFECCDLDKIHDTLKTQGATVEHIYLNTQEGHPEASVLIIRNGVDWLLGAGSADGLLKENIAFDWDTKYWDRRRSKVLNKRARYNVCYGDTSRPAAFEQGCGTIIGYQGVPLTKALKDALPSVFGEKAKSLQLEGNYYYDIKKCGIGFHGDTERSKVIGVRLGEPIPLVYKWYKHAKVVSDPMVFHLEHGDMYVMSKKAVGNDWKKRNIYSLRHAAGCKKYTGLES